MVAVVVSNGEAVPTSQAQAQPVARGSNTVRQTHICIRTIIGIPPSTVHRNAVSGPTSSVEPLSGEFIGSTHQIHLLSMIQSPLISLPTNFQCLKIALKISSISCPGLLRDCAKPDPPALCATYSLQKGSLCL